MLSHAMVQRRQLLIKFLFGPAPLQLVAWSQVDKTGVASEPWMAFAHPAEHLLRDPAVVGVALGGGPQLAQVEHLAEVGAEVPADAKRQRNQVLGERRAGVAFELGVDGCRG